MAKIFVGNIPVNYDDSDLLNLFASCGKVVAAKVIKDRYSSRSRGFGIVEMSNVEDARRAIELYNGKDVEGQRLVVNEAHV